MKYFFNEEDANKRQISPGISLKTIWGDKIMMSLVELEPNSEVPLHTHPNEQAGIVLEGEFIFTIGGQSKTVKTGEFYVIPGGIEHSVLSGSKSSKALDIFSPPRDDYKS